MVTSKNQWDYIDGKKIQKFSSVWRSNLLMEDFMKARKDIIPYKLNALYKIIPERLRLILIKILENLMIVDLDKS